MIFDEVIFRDEKIFFDFDNSNIILRNAVRAVIADKNKILMVFLGKTKEYKFPGGGMENNETIEEALNREVLEEIGHKINKIGEKIGTITEYSIAKEGNNNIFKMVSEYYTVKIDKNKTEQSLDEYEKELKFKPIWIETETAYKINKSLIENKHDLTPWIKRETRVLEILKDMINE